MEEVKSQIKELLLLLLRQTWGNNTFWTLYTVLIKNLVKLLNKK